MSEVRQIIVESEKAVAEALADRIADELAYGQKVLWFISGGSSIPVAVQAAVILAAGETRNLQAVLVDDFAEPVSLRAKNWHHLQSAGWPKQIGLSGIVGEQVRLADIANDYNKLVAEKLAWADFTIGQFGLGEGHHTGGIVADSPAVLSDDLVCGYQLGHEAKITVTPKLISELDAVFINSLGESKRELVAHFLVSQALVNDEPTQALKTAKKTELYSDVLD